MIPCVDSPSCSALSAPPSRCLRAPRRPPAPPPCSSATCLPASAPVFAGDTNAYFLLSGGSFEAGLPAWSFAGGAALVAGNNTAGGDPLTNTRSLSLPGRELRDEPGGVRDPTSPTIRFYVRNTGASDLAAGR